MIRRLTIVILLLLSSASDLRATATSPQDPQDVVKALEQWLKAYQNNKIDLGSREDVGRDSAGRRNRALPRGLLGTLTPRRELEALVDQAAAHESTDTLHAVLAIAAIGQDDVRYDFRAMAHVAREIGARGLDRFASDESRAELRRVAGSGMRGAKGRGEAKQAAALRALGAFPDASVDLGLFEGALGHSDPDVRAGAADAIARAGATTALAAVSAAIDEETEPTAMQALGRAGAKLVASSGAGEDRATLAMAAANALGRTSWRADEALISLLRSARERAAVPALISVLARFETESKAIRSGRLSGVLRLRAHEALLDLTGAFFGADEPQQWRDWWDEHKDTFEIAAPKPEPTGGDARTEAGFFGIPVNGTRVVFVIDLSLSMEAPMPPSGTSDGNRSNWPTRLDVAREQVWDAAQKLNEDAVFDVVVFSEQARRWQGKLVSASDSNRKKLRRFLDELRPEPYTNLWEGMKLAMEFASGSDAADNTLELDELFVLSDGAPTIGELTDAREILRVITEANRHKRIRIHTVFLQGEGSAMDPEVAEGRMGPGELMAAIAEQNDGRFVKR